MENDINLEKWLTDDEYKHAEIIYHNCPMYKIARLRKEKAELEDKLVIALEALVFYANRKWENEGDWTFEREYNLELRAKEALSEIREEE